jgi:hypothetical protein
VATGLLVRGLAGRGNSGATGGRITADDARITAHGLREVAARSGVACERRNLEELDAADRRHDVEALVTLR